MKKSLLFLSVGYWFSSYTLGLLLHPYKTVRALVRKRKFYSLVFVPVVVWVVFWVIGMIGLRLGGIILSLLGLVATIRFVHILGFLFWWLTWFMVLWQVLVGYLFIRFWVTLKN
jgi:hypothetical protein